MRQNAEGGEHVALYEKVMDEFNAKRLSMGPLIEAAVQYRSQMEVRVDSIPSEQDEDEEDEGDSGDDERSDDKADLGDDEDANTY